MILNKYYYFSALTIISRKPNCPFTLFVGAKKLIKPKEFEEYPRNTDRYSPISIEKRISMYYNMDITLIP